MAPIRGIYTSIIVDNVNLDGQSNNLQVSVQNGVIEVTPFQSTAKQFLSEPPQGNIVHGGYFYGDTAGSIERETFVRLGEGTNYVSALFGTDTAACVAYVAPGNDATGLQIQAQPSGVITVQGDWNAGSGLQRGIRMFDGTISGTGAQAHVDLAAAGTNGFAYLHVRTITGSATNATITVQSDDNTGFTSAATHGTFTFSGTNGFAMVITGTIDRYVRINATSMGGATSFVVTAIIVSTGVTM
jgi:hypothetical protein